LDTNLLPFLLSPSLLPANWEIIDMGGSPTSMTMNGIAIARGRNDGINKIYAGSFDGHVYEFTYNGTS